MKKKQPTAAERRAKDEQAERREWEKFKQRLESAASWLDAYQIALGPAPARGEPGHSLYSNLAFFIKHTMMPDGANSDERALYLGLVRRMRASGEMNEPSLVRFEQLFEP